MLVVPDEVGMGLGIDREGRGLGLYYRGSLVLLYVKIMITSIVHKQDAGNLTQDKLARPTL